MLVNNETSGINLIANGVQEMHFGENSAPKVQGISDWDMVNLTNDLESFKLDEGDSSKPKNSQEPDWLVVDLVRVPNGTTEVRPPGVIPEQSHMAQAKVIKISSVCDNLEGDAMRFQAPVPPRGKAAGKFSVGMRGKRHRKKKKKEEKKFFPFAPHHFFKKKEILCWVCGLPGHIARKCIHRKGRGPSGESKKAHKRLDDFSSNGDVLVG